jgi:hypothetical protein
VAELLAEGERPVNKRQRTASSGSTTFTWCATTSDLAPRIEHADPYQLDAQTAQPKRSASDLYWDDVKRENEEKRRRFELTAAERDPFTARLLKDYSRQTDTTRINAFDEYNTATIKVDGAPGQYRQPFQFWADDYKVDSIFSTPGMIDNIRMERLHKIRGTVNQHIQYIHQQDAEATSMADAAEDTAKSEDQPQIKPAAMPIPVLKIAPPSNARFLLSLVLSPSDRQATVGDLIEEYHSYIVPEFGERRARIWFWTQAVESILPIISRRLVRFAAGVTVWRAATAIVRRFVK